MNLYTRNPFSPAVLLKSIWFNRRLIMQMAWREVVGRYKGSVFGLLWSFATPLLMLAVYTFVFSVVFKARWGDMNMGGGKAEFALILFSGLIVHGFFAEVLNRSTTLIISNANYVKKVVFPLEVLTVISAVSGLFHVLTSLLILLIVYFLVYGQLQPTIVLFPIVVIPLVIWVLGVAWFFASIGVYLRDVGQLMGIFTSVMLFVSPIFFPPEAIPEQYRLLIWLNPLTLVIDQVREVIIWGRLPDWTALGIYSTISCLVGWLGFFWFQKTRKGFADVL